MAISPFKVIQGHQFWYQSKAHIDFLLVINTNLPPILHRFGVIAFRMSQISIFRYPLAFKSPDLRKIFSECQWMAKEPNGEEKLPKISSG